MQLFVSGDFNRKKKKSDSVLWQTPLHQQKCQKGNITTQTTPQKSLITQRLRTDLGQSVGVTTATKLAWLTGLRAQPSHSPQQPCNHTFKWGKVNWLFNVTIKNFSVIHVTAHRCAGGLKKKWLDLRSGSQRHRHFVGFSIVGATVTVHQFFCILHLTCPCKHRHGTNLFIRWFRHIAQLVAFYDTLGIRRTHSRL